MKLGGDNFFQDLGDERQVGDGPVICVDCGIQGGFLKEGCDDGGF